MYHVYSAQGYKSEGSIPDGLTVASSILSLPTNLPSRSRGWVSSTSSEPWSSMRTISSCEILTNPEGSLGFEDEEARVIGISMILGMVL